jgi:hypothetical protein
VDVLASTAQKIDSMLEKIRALSAGDFPQPDATDALAVMEQIFSDHRDQVRDLQENGGAPTAIPTYCSKVVHDLFAYLPVLGFLHRSKNSGNAFEVYGPLLDLARKVIGPQTRLILSSEWDFSPYTLLELPQLPSFVLLGLPASESRTVLLAPLAGHEFGHAIWAAEGGEGRYEGPVSDDVIQAIRIRWEEYQSHFRNVSEGSLTTDLFALQTWIPAARWAVEQCEEVFCDLVGLRIFGAAYLHAFGYLVAPGITSERVPRYPTVPQRARYLTLACERYGIAVPSNYIDLFQSLPPEPPSSRSFLISIADDAVKSQIERLIDHADQYVASKGVVLPTSAEVESIYKAFDGLIPAAHPASLPAIVNAGWKAVHAGDFWSAYPQVDKRRPTVLNELMLKTAQVLEVRELLGRST